MACIVSCHSKCSDQQAGSNSVKGNTSQWVVLVVEDSTISGCHFLSCRTCSDCYAAQVRDGDFYTQLYCHGEYPRQGHFLGYGTFQCINWNWQKVVSSFGYDTRTEIFVWHSCHGLYIDGSGYHHPEMFHWTSGYTYKWFPVKCIPLIPVPNYLHPCFHWAHSYVLIPYLAGGT